MRHRMAAATNATASASRTTARHRAMWLGNAPPVRREPWEDVGGSRIAPFVVTAGVRFVSALIWNFLIDAEKPLIQDQAAGS
jgi:hypothetical protein